MSPQGPFMRDLHAAERDKITVSEGVYVVAHSGSNLAIASEQPLGAHQVVRGRHLEILLFPRNQGNGDTCLFCYCGVIRFLTRGPGAMCRQYGGKMESLRGLHTQQIAAIWASQQQAVLG